MKKIVISTLCAYIFLFILSSPTLSQDNQNPTLSDAVYADLAVRGFLDNVSVSFYDGNPANEINISENKHWLPASCVKLFVAMYAYKQIADKKLSLTDEIAVDSKNVVPTEFVTTEFPAIQAGDTPTIDTLIRIMITQSDNTAFNVLLDVLDRQAITDYIHKIGLTHSVVGSKLNLDTSQEQSEFDVPGYGINSTTADDYTKAFISIWRNQIAGANSLLEVLKQQKINYMLPLLLPKDVVVAHKHGDLDPLFHDGGIIFGSKNTYVVSIFTNLGDPDFVAHLSDLIYTQNYNLVGSGIQRNPQLNQISDNFPPIDPLVMEGKKLASNILGAQTQVLQTQPITAADLGITAKDLSLVESKSQLPQVVIPADSNLHFLVPAWQLLKKGFALGNKGRFQADVDTVRLQIAEAKDLVTRGNVSLANQVLRSTQPKINSLVQTPEVKSSAETQTAIQSASETRFQVFADALKNAQVANRNMLIKEIGSEARDTLKQVQPVIPLATNATNPTQKPLIGQIVDKSDTKLVIKTAGGQQLTIPLTDQTLNVKTRVVTPNITLLSVTPSESLSETLTPTPAAQGKTSIANVELGTTIALIGSSVGNTFTPTFVLTNVPKELAAPEPVTVIKADRKNHTMVISENGNPVQVNISNETAIRGQDTDINFSQIRPGDVVVVHGAPLIPIAPINITTTITTAPRITSSVPSTAVSSSPTSNSITNSSVTSVPSVSNISSAPPTIQSSSQNKNLTGTVNITQTQKNNPTNSINISQPQSFQKGLLTQAPQNNDKNQPFQTKQNTINQNTGNVKNQINQTNNQTQTAPPKVIQSTSIQIVEKKENVVKTQSQPSQPSQSNNQPKQPAKPQNPPAQPQNNSQPATNNDKKSNPAPTAATKK